MPTRSAAVSCAARPLRQAERLAVETLPNPRDQAVAPSRALSSWGTPSGQNRASACSISRRLRVAPESRFDLRMLAVEAEAAQRRVELLLDQVVLQLLEPVADRFVRAAHNCPPG